MCMYVFCACVVLFLDDAKAHVVGVVYRTNGRAIATLLRLSVCDVMYCG